MKKLTIILLLLGWMPGIDFQVLAQQPLTNTSPPAPANGQDNASYWSRAGNTNLNGTNNIFGTKWNSPIYGITNNVLRTRLNGDLTSTIAFVNNINTSGYFGLGNFAGVSCLGNNGPWSMLHLEGPNNFGQYPHGWRTWMRTGMFINEHTDHLYVGLREITGVTNRSDAMLSWGDDHDDPFRFVFISGTASGGGNGSSDPTHGKGLSGYQYMMMIPHNSVMNDQNFPAGHIGIGPLFVNGTIPQSRLHQHSEDYLHNYLQITSEMGTGVAGTDGLRLGLMNVPNNALQSGNALLYNQENKHLLFGTGLATPANPMSPNDRLRIASLSAPTKDVSGNYGSFNPGGNPDGSVTRVGISYRPSSVLTAPLSLVHMGENVSTALDGWRNWMEVGTFVSMKTNSFAPAGANFYSGLNYFPGSDAASMDAVIAWGFNPTLANQPGNRLRFIFNSPTNFTYLSSANSGLEAGHFYCDGDNTRLGVGNFMAGDPNNTLDIKSSPSSPHWPITTPGGCSGLRLSNLTATTIPDFNPGPGVLAVDMNGDVIYVRQTTSSSFGGSCNSPASIPVLSSDHAVNLNGNNFYWEGNGNGAASDNLLIGKVCGDIPRAKVDIFQQSGSDGSKGLYIENTDPSNVGGPGPVFGLDCFVPGIPGAPSIGQIGGRFITSGEKLNISVDALANGMGPGANFGGRFEAINGGLNYGIYATAPNVVMNNPNDLAGYFQGDVWINGLTCGNNFAQTISDIRFKTRVNPLNNAMDIISRLQPKSYFYNNDYPYLRFDKEEQFGLIAQEVETVLPQIVKKVMVPAELDDKGNILNAPFEALGVKYDELIPVLIQAMKEQQEMIKTDQEQNASLKKLLDEQQKQIDELKNAVANCCINNSGDQAKTTSTGNSDIQLTNGEAVVLNQNVPNPFAEQTVISFYVPESVNKAMIIFYENRGQMLQSVEIKTRGKGQITVFANDLSNGLYSYRLIADEKVIDTKKMIKQD